MMVASIAGCSEVEPSSHGLVNACAAFPSEAHAAHRYAWVNNSATCCETATEEFHGPTPPKPEQPVKRPESEEHTLYGTSAKEAEASLQRRSERSWWRRFFGLE